MSTSEIAKDLVDLCRNGKNMDAISKYYSDNVVSVESASGPGMPAQMEGLETIKNKNQWWMENHEIHSSEANGPFVGENQFAVEFKYDVTEKASRKRFQMNEMALYTVEGGKIVHEHFFYSTGS
ncbi:MAG: nuclear transport factor 2 family protein [Acidobacteriota bacterium]|nr:nuclear transport factor 2 family protein [Acidobacteriota bacterium]